MDCREAISWVGGDLGKLAGATGQSSPRKARWSMEWKRASRRSLLEACLASSSRILATQAANSFCSVDGGRIAAIFSKADLLIMRVITPVARFCITLLSALT